MIFLQLNCLVIWTQSSPSVIFFQRFFACGWAVSLSLALCHFLSTSTTSTSLSEFSCWWGAALVHFTFTISTSKLSDSSCLICARGLFLHFLFFWGLDGVLSYSELSEISIGGEEHCGWKSRGVDKNSEEEVPEQFEFFDAMEASISVRKSGSVRFFAPKTGNHRLQLV